MFIELKEKPRNYFTSSLEAFSMSALGTSPCASSNPLSTNHMRELGFLTFAATDGAGHQKIIKCDGTAKIFENNDQVYTFSAHSKKNYPLVKQQSNKDIELADDITDEEYLNTVSKSLEVVNKMNFDFVFYVAGVDIHKDDKLGKLNITTEGIEKREKMVIDNFYKNKIPLCGVLGGGYNKDFNHLVYLHSILHRTCHEILSNEH